MVIAIANDHGGVGLKSILVKRLESQGHTVFNLGTDSAEIARYPLFAIEAMKMVRHKKADRGILICSTGIGMSIIANKHRGIRAALCTDSYMAKMTRKHNDTNILCIGGKITGEDLAMDICDVWLNTEFEGGRHCISLGIIAEVEEAIIADMEWSPPAGKVY